MKPSYFSDDIRALLAILERYDVRYMLVGGEAVIYYGYPRFTGDIDIFYAQNAANSGRLYDALREFWGGVVPGVADAAELMETNVVVQFGRPPNRIDLLSRISGLEFSDAWPGRCTVLLEGDEPSQIVPIGLDDLLRNKRAAGRPKDLLDADFLERVRDKSKS